MPRFDFQFLGSDPSSPDAVGVEFPDAQAAIREARRTAAEMMRDAAMDGRTLDGGLEVFDSDGVMILRVRSVEEGV